MTVVIFTIPNSTPVESDCGPLHGHVRALLDGGVAPTCLRDATRLGTRRILDLLSGEQLPRIC